MSRRRQGVVRGHTRDRTWRMGTEDPTANIPVASFDVVPAGPLQGRRRWARLLLWSHVEVEWVRPPRRGLRGSRAWPNEPRRWRRRRRQWRCHLKPMEPRRHALRLQEQPVGGLLHGGPPRLQTGQLFQRLGHQGLKTVGLLREVVHGVSHLRFKFGGLPRRQIATGEIGEIFLMEFVVERLLIPIVTIPQETSSRTERNRGRGPEESRGRGRTRTREGFGYWFVI